MSGMVGFIVGVGIGIAGTWVVKGKNDSAEINAIKRQLNEVWSENEKLSRRYKEAERHNEDLHAELEKLQRHAKSDSSDKEDLQDELEDARYKVKKLSAEKTELLREIEEYRQALAAAKTK